MSCTLRNKELSSSPTHSILNGKNNHKQQILLKYVVRTFELIDVVKCHELNEINFIPFLRL